MKQFCKKGIPLLLAALLLSALLPVTAQAATSGKCGDKAKWSYSDGVLTVKGSGTMEDYSTVLAAPWSEYSERILQVKIGSGITRVGNQAFYNCTNLTSVSLPDGLLTIGDHAFKNCTALTYAAFPSSLERIGESAFENCAVLKGIRLPDGLKSIGDYAFYRCSSLQTISVPATVTDFGLVVFAYCKNLVGAVLNCPMTQVPDWTFYDCTALQSVVLADTVSTAGTFAFHNCKNVTAVYYTGDSSSALLESIRQDVSSNVRINDEPYTGTMKREVGSLAFDSTEGTAATTETTETENATIQVRTDSDAKYYIDGESSTLGEVLALTADSREKVTVETTDTKTITATVDNSTGWDELAEAIGIASEGETQSTAEQVDVKVQISGDTVSGADIKKIARENATLEITTENGSTWYLDTSEEGISDIKDKNYDISYTAERVEKGKSGIDSEDVYKLEVSDILSKNSSIAVHLDEDKAGSYASLYDGGLLGGKLKETVLIDNDGNAWFDAENLSGHKTYYIGVDVKGVDTSEAIIPHTMAEQYNLVSDSDYTLTDADGNQYEVGERESSWGITGKQFALYVGIGIGGLVLIVTIVMVSINTVKKSKRKVEAEFAPEEAEESVEEMRTRIMKEMLSKLKKNDKTEHSENSETSQKN